MKNQSTVMLLLMCLCTIKATLHYTQGESFLLPYFTTTLSAVGCTLSNTTDTVPYLVANDSNQHSLSLSFSLPSNTTSIWVTSLTRNFDSIRLDSKQPVLLTVTSSVSIPNQSRAPLVITYMRTDSNGTVSYPSMVVMTQCWLTGCSVNLSPAQTVTFGGVVFEVVPTAALPMLKRYPHGAFSSWSVDVMDISRWLVANGYLRSFDMLYGMRLGVQAWWVGSYTSVLNLTLPPVRNLYGNFTGMVGNLPIVNEAVLQTSTTTDYANTSMPTSTPFAIDQVNYQFLLASSTSPGVKCCSRVIVGYYLGSWLTGHGDYRLPLPLNQKIGFLASFAFTEVDLSSPTSKTACVSLFLRDDYNSMTNTFTNQSHKMQVKVCQWWSTSLERPTKMQNTVYFNGSMYDAYASTQKIISSSSTIQVYTFINQGNSLRADKVDLYAFARYLVNLGEVPSSMLVAAASMGFCGYSGSARFEFLQAAFLVQDVDDFAQGMNITVAAPLQCIVLSELYERQECIPARYLYETVYYLLSTPSIALLLRLTPFSVLLDQLSYYSYHPAPYDRSFKALSDLSWNLTNSKWFPSIVSFLYDSYQQNVAQPCSIADSRVVTPDILLIKGEDVFFLNMTLDYWVWTVPLNIITFGLVYLLSRAVTSPAMSLILKPFSSVSYLLISLVCDNVAFMTFRGFIQARYLLYNHQSPTLSAINLVLVGTASWLFMCGGLAIPTVIYHCKSYYQGRRELGPHLLLTATLLLRVLSSFLHASQLPMTYRICGLASIQLVGLSLTIKYRTHLTRQTLYTLLPSQLLKIFLHGLLIFEVIHGDVHGSSMSYAFNTSTASIVIGLFLVLLAGLAIDIGWEAYHFCLKYCRKSQRKVKAKRIIKRVKPVQEATQDSQIVRYTQPQPTTLKPSKYLLRIRKMVNRDGQLQVQAKSKVIDAELNPL